MRKSSVIYICTISLSLSLSSKILSSLIWLMRNKSQHLNDEKNFLINKSLLYKCKDRAYLGVISKLCSRTAILLEMFFDFNYRVVNYRDSIGFVGPRYGKQQTYPAEKHRSQRSLLWSEGIERKPVVSVEFAVGVNRHSPRHCGRKGKEMRVSGWLSATRETFRTVYRFSRELRSFLRLH